MCSALLVGAAGPALAAGLDDTAAPAGALITLQAAYESALVEDPTWRAAQYARDAGVEARALGRAELLPTLSANYGVQRNRADIDFTNTLGSQTENRRYQSSNGGLLLRQPLFYAEGLARYRQGVAQAEASEAEMVSARQALLLRVFAQYAEANQAEVELALAEAKRAQLIEQRNSNVELLARGEGTVTDRLETQARLDLAEAEVIIAEDLVADAREALAATTGRPVPGVVGLPDDFLPAMGTPSTLNEWLERAQAENPDLNAQRALVRAAAQEARRAKAARLPRLDLVANISKADSDTVSTFEQDSVTSGVGVQMSMPIITGGANSAAIRQAEANRSKEAAMLDALLNEVLVELRRQFNATESGRARISALMASLESARLVVTATEQSVRAGVRTNLDVLEARSTWFEVRRDLSLARYQYLLAELGLRRAAGTLTEVDLQGVARHFR
jgi:protease secretion system outer membrane protein